MKNPKRIVIMLNQVMQALFWLLLIRGVITSIQRIAAIYMLSTDPSALLGYMSLTIDWLVLDAQNGFGIDLNTGIAMNVLQLASGIVITIIACLCIRSLRNILLSIELGQPFRGGMDAELSRLSRYCFAFAITENIWHLLSMLLIESGYDLEGILLTDPITDVHMNVQVKPAWFFVSAVVMILSMVFRRGEELQTLSDETL